VGVGGGAYRRTAAKKREKNQFPQLGTKKRVFAASLQNELKVKRNWYSRFQAKKRNQNIDTATFGQKKKHEAKRNLSCGSERQGDIENEALLDGRAFE